MCTVGGRKKQKAAYLALVLDRSDSALLGPVDGTSSDGLVVVHGVASGTRSVADVRHVEVELVELSVGEVRELVVAEGVGGLLRVVLIDDAIVLEERGEALLEKGNGGVGLGVRAHPTAEGGLIGSRGDGGDEKEAGEHCCRWGVLEKSGCAKRRPEKSSRACGRSMGDVR